MNDREHWEQIYTTKRATEVSWYQREPRLSLELIFGSAAARDSVIYDIGGGASTVVDGLLSRGYRMVTVLDLASAPLECAKARLKERSGLASWICADVLSYPLPESSIDVWHDRAVFHFLTRAEDRDRYRSQVLSAVRPGGAVIVATFSPDGPTRCSGLDVVRYGAEELHAQFGRSFELIESVRELHTTPSGAIQSFQYCRCRLRPAAISAA